MDIVFCGTAPGVGTSANMTVVREALRCRGFAVDEMHFIDCSYGEVNFRKYPDKTTLFIVNLLIPNKELESFYFHHLLVRENIIFLFGKYFQETEKELHRFMVEYRVDAGRIARITYSTRFRRALESGEVSAYLQKKPRSVEDEMFALSLWKTTQTILKYL